MKYAIEKLGDATVLSPLGLSLLNGDGIANFIEDSKRIVVDANFSNWHQYHESGKEPDTFEAAGPREKIFFDPATVRAAIVTCGGLCPGLNDVIRALVMTLHYRYGVRDILGVRYGYRGMTLHYGGTAIPLTPELVVDIHTRGGTFLGSSRGPQSVVEMVDFLQRRSINMLFTLGGDGTIRGAIEIAEESRKRNLNISVVGIPKTIDNDIAFIDRSFGFSSAVAKAKEIIDAAHAEARGAPYGIGLVKLMGRRSGFIAARASLASGDVNCVLVPEVKFELDGNNGFFKWLETRLEQRHHALIVAAEGAGEDLMANKNNTRETDASGNVRLVDIGIFLKDEINEHFKKLSRDVTLKYFDPSYLIRSTTANAEDSVFCSELAQHAVHAAFSGRTAMLIGTWNNHFVHLPMSLTISKRKTLDPDGLEWLSVVENTGQPPRMTN